MVYDEYVIAGKTCEERKEPPTIPMSSSDGAAGNSGVPLSKSARKKQRRKPAKQADETARAYGSEVTGGKPASDQTIVTDSPHLADPKSVQVK